MRVAVIIPCLDEELTIGTVIRDFKRNLPDADIFVYDNMSEDDTRKEAVKNGARLCVCSKRGKGAAIRQAFREIDADVYVMVDGDDTYPPDRIKDLVELVKSGRADLVVGDRIHSYFDENKSVLHAIGNKMVPWLFNRLYGISNIDIMSGSRVMSREFVKNFPAKEDGFGLETEMMIYASKRGYTVMSVDVPYRDRPEGSKSDM